MAAGTYISIVLCGIEAVVLGMLWYGPFFGKPWRAEMNITDEDVECAKTDPVMKKKMMKSAGLAFIGAGVTAFVLRHLIIFGNAYMQTSGIEGSLETAFWCWLGFSMPVLLGAVLWENKTWKWWWISISYYLVSLLLMATILSFWI